MTQTSTKISLNLDEDLLWRVGKYAEEHDSTRTGVITTALVEFFGLYCPNCGKPLVRTRYCGHCGTLINPDLEDE